MDIGHKTSERLAYLARSLSEQYQSQMSDAEINGSNSMDPSTSCQQPICSYVADTYHCGLDKATKKLPITRMKECYTHLGGLCSPCGKKLCDCSISSTLENLLRLYGRTAHMGIRDPSYSVYINSTRDAAILYKSIGHVAVISGDPICHPGSATNIIQEFRFFCKSKSWIVTIVGASKDLATVARQQDWITMQFAIEKVLNPINNAILLGQRGKRTRQKCNQLLKAGFTVKLYCSASQYDSDIESKLQRLYTEWRSVRNRQEKPRAFVTVFDLFTMPNLITYIYVEDPQHKPIGFAGLRKTTLGAHIDPVISSSDAPSGIGDLLMVAAMGLGLQLGLGHLSLGFEPLPELKDVTGISGPAAKILRSAHGRIYDKTSMAGKQAYHQRLYPDPGQDGELYMIFCEEPGIGVLLATMRYANISLTDIISAHLSDPFRKIFSPKRKSDERKSSTLR